MMCLHLTPSGSITAGMTPPLPQLLEGELINAEHREIEV
jgi:hypothetical protein